MVDEQFITTHTAEVPLADGGRIVVRPIVPEDKSALAAGFDRLSDESRRFRFFRSRDSLTGGELAYLTEIDYVDHFAWVALAADEEAVGLGVARYVRVADDPTVAEPAVTVVDEHQRRGIGGILVGLLSESAAQNGINRFRAEVLGDNAEVRGGIEGIGRVTEVHSGVLSIEIEVPLSSDAFRDSSTYGLLRSVARGDVVPRPLDHDGTLSEPDDGEGPLTAIEDEVDEAAAHRHFAAAAFNGTWDLIDKTDRSDAETDEMIHQAHAARWHWGRRDDVSPVNLAISAWQLSRVYAVAGNADEARRYATESLHLVDENDLPPFHRGYAHEALARTAAVVGDEDRRDHHVAAARDAAAAIDDEEHRDLLLADVSALTAE